MGSQEPPQKTIIGEASLGSFIKVLVRTPPLIVSGIRFGGSAPPPGTTSLRQGPWFPRDSPSGSEWILKGIPTEHSFLIPLISNSAHF